MGDGGLPGDLDQGQDVEVRLVFVQPLVVGAVLTAYNTHNPMSIHAT